MALMIVSCNFGETEMTPIENVKYKADSERHEAITLAYEAEAKAYNEGDLEKAFLYAYIAELLEIIEDMENTYED